MKVYIELGRIEQQGTVGDYVIWQIKSYSLIPLPGLIPYEIENTADFESLLNRQPIASPEKLNAFFFRQFTMGGAGGAGGSAGPGGAAGGGGGAGGFVGGAGGTGGIINNNYNEGFKRGAFIFGTLSAIIAAIISAYITHWLGLSH